MTPTQDRTNLATLRRMATSRLPGAAQAAGPGEHERAELARAGRHDAEAGLPVGRASPLGRNVAAMRIALPRQPASASIRRRTSAPRWCSIHSAGGWRWSSGKSACRPSHASQRRCDRTTISASARPTAVRAQRSSSRDEPAAEREPARRPPARRACGRGGARPRRPPRPARAARAVFAGHAPRERKPGRRPGPARRRPGPARAPATYSARARRRSSPRRSC